MSTSSAGSFWRNNLETWALPLSWLSRSCYAKSLISNSFQFRNSEIWTNSLNVIFVVAFWGLARPKNIWIIQNPDIFTLKIICGCFFNYKTMKFPDLLVYQVCLFSSHVMPVIQFQRRSIFLVQITKLSCKFCIRDLNNQRYFFLGLNN